MTNLLVYSMVMIRLNIHEIKSQFSKYVDLVEKGETILVCKRNLPVAELRPVHQSKNRKPILGAAKDTFEISSSFYEPLPEDLLQAFEGKPNKAKK